MEPLVLNRTLGAGVRIAIVFAFAAAAYRTVLASRADLEYRTATATGVFKAERLMPSNPAYHYAAALLLQQNEPTSPAIEREFAAAVADNPRYSDALLAWSVEKELRGDKAGAERLLMDARHIDRLLRPAWALANFYFRQRDTPNLLAEAHECLRIIGVTGLSEGRFDPAPIYDLCWKSGASPEDILNKVIPNDPNILDHYLGYLVGTNQLPAATQAAQRLLPIVPKDDFIFLGPYFTKLLNLDQMDSAVQIWRAFL